MKSEDNTREANERNDDNFIMLPTVDFCFKGLMNNPKVRKGFIAALLKKDPETIRETVLLPTVLSQEYQDDKLGILDVRVLMEDKTQIDMEMQVAYFVTRRPGKNIQISWKYRFWNLKSCLRILKAGMTLLNG